MTPKRRAGLIGITVIAMATGLAEYARAAPITWQGGEVDWVDGGATSNWNPADEPDSNDEAIFNTSNTVNLGSNNTIIALTMSGGISLDTNDFDLTIDGLLQLTAGGTDLTIAGAASSVAPDSVTINSGAAIFLGGGTLLINEETAAGLFDINLGGTLSGQGTLSLADSSLGAATTLLTNSGTISAVAPGLFIGVPAVGTLAINATDATNARLDLDLGGTAVINVFRNQTLDINVQLFDAYSDDLNLFHNATLDLSKAWSINAGATVDIDNGFVNNGGFLDIPASTSFIAGAAFTQSGGTITVIDADGALQFNASFTHTAGDLVNNGEVIFNANATIGIGANFTMPTATSSLTVNAGAVVNIDQPTFNTDGGGTATNVITLQSGAILDLDLGVGADTGIGSTVNFNGGEIDVTTDPNTWSFNGTINVGAATGTSQINGEAVTFSSVPVTIGDGSVLDVNATSTWSSSAPAAVGTGSTLRLDGIATVLSGAPFTGAGTLALGSTSTVSANTTIATGIFDYDGSGIGTLHTINDGVVFTINSPLFDTDGDMDDPMNLGGNGASLVMNGPLSWEMKGALTANPADVGTAIVGGTSRMVLTTATGILNADGNSAINAPVTFGAASTANVAAPAILTLNGNAIYDGGIITGAGLFIPSPGSNNTVNSASTISTASFDFDAGNWEIQPGATLTVNVADYDTTSPNTFDNLVTINSGAASVTTGDTAFVMDGTLTLNNSTGTAPVWSGEPLQIGNDLSALDANLNVIGSGTSRISSSVTFLSDADVSIGAGCTLALNSTANFEPVNAADNAEFTGTGTLATDSTVNFNETTTLNMTGGTVDLDGTDLIGSTINVEAPVTINAAAMSSFGKANLVGTSILDIDSLNVGATGALNVVLDDPAGEWTLNSEGVLNLTNDNVQATLLAGADLNLNGTTNVTGEVRSTARLDIEGTIDILTAAQRFQLGAGNATNDPNTIVGGTINGPGRLGSSGNRALVGFGTINASLDVGFSSDVLADNGELRLTNALVFSVNNLGTADTDGILNVIPNWDAAMVDLILLQGGEFRGGTIQNNATSGIRGRGLVSARVVNNIGVQANSALSPLILQTADANNDWDGATNAGTLQASTSGILELRDNASFLFQGTVSGVGGGTVFTNGFELEMEPGSNLNLTNGTFRGTGGISTDLGGAITIGLGTSNLQINAFMGNFVFEATSATTLTGNLQLDSASIVRAGATFAGAGHLINLPGRTLAPDNLADMNIFLENRGTFSPAANLPARNDLLDFSQSGTGVLAINLSGTPLGTFDRVLVDGSAQLAGGLALTLGGGYVPAINDLFTILTAPGGVTGTFDSLVQPAGMPAGRIFEIVYSPASVQLRVIAATPYDIWIASFASITNPADRVKGANPDNDELNNQGEFALDGNPASGAASGKVVMKIAPVSGTNALTLTLPVRTGAILDPADPAGGELGLLKAADAVSYRIQASDQLSNWTLTVTEVIDADAAAIQLGLPPLNPGWSYRTFRSPGAVIGDPVEFMRIFVGE